MRALTYWHTIRYLKWQQIYSRLNRVRCKRRKVSKAVSNIKLQSQISSLRAPACINKTFFPKHGIISLLNNDRAIKQLAQQDMLWRYNYYYFDCLLAKELDQRNQADQAFQGWLEASEIFEGEAWDAYPVSLRILTLAKRSLLDNGFANQYAQLLFWHARFLSKNLETHILGNHFLENIIALCVAGLYFDMPEAKAWLNKGQILLAKELTEQILPDGGHFELSPMYHAIILERLLDLMSFGQVFVYDFKLESTIQKMFFWLEAMSHPDDKISFFNDANFTMGPTNQSLRDYADRLNIKWSSRNFGLITYLDSSGYIRLNSENAVCLIDVAKVGPDYIPGHAHADTLSFEMSVFGKRVIVNSGTSTYWQQPLRHEQRSTAMHNTVEVDGQNSSEVWGQFRVARRAKILFCDISESRDGVHIRVAHDGYKRLGVNHARSFWFQAKRNQLVLVDQLQGKKKPWVSRLHIHPYMIGWKGLNISHTADDLEMYSSHFYPEMNRQLNSQVYAFKMKPHSQRLETVLSWAHALHDS